MRGIKKKEKRSVPAKNVEKHSTVLLTIALRFVFRPSLREVDLFFRNTHTNKNESKHLYVLSPFQFDFVSLFAAVVGISLFVAGNALYID